MELSRTSGPGPAKPAHPSPRVDRGRPLLALKLAALAVIGGVLAAPSLTNAFVFDDLAKIVNNTDIRTLDPGQMIKPYDNAPHRNRNDPSRPLVSATYALNYAAGGLDPLGYHLVDAALHIFVAMLVLIFLQRLLPPQLRGVPEVGALLFLCHPLLFGTAQYVYARSDLLASAFALAALAIWARERRSIAIAMLYAAALLSKPSAIILPLALAAYDHFIRKDLRLRPLLPAAALALAYLAFRSFYLGGLGDLEADPATLWDRRRYLDTQFYAVARYLQLFFFPSGLSMDHAIYPGGLSILEHALSYATAAALAILFWRTKNALVRFGLVFFVLALLPTSSIFPTTDALVERRVYLASLGLLLVIIGLLDRRAIYLAPAIPLFALLTVARAGEGRTEKTFWEAALAQYPNHDRALFRLAQIHADEGDDAGALALYDRLFHAFPRHFAGYNSIGAYYYRRGRPELAEKFFRFALSISPDYVAARVNLEQTSTATAANTIAQQLSPDLAENAELIISLYRAQIEAEPTSIKFRKKLIEFLLLADRKNEALAELEALALLQPDDREIQRRIAELQHSR